MKRFVVKFPSIDHRDNFRRRVNSFLCSDQMFDEKFRSAVMLDNISLEQEAKIRRLLPEFCGSLVKEVDFGSVKKPIREIIDEARSAGQDALGIANDPEALKDLDRMLEKYGKDPTHYQAFLDEQTIAMDMETFLEEQNRGRVGKFIMWMLVVLAVFGGISALTVLYLEKLAQAIAL